MKKFFGGKFMDKENLLLEGISYPVKLEYYKVEEKSREEKGRDVFSIEVIKTEYLENKVNVETKMVENFSFDEEETNHILEKLKQYEVTPVTIKDVIDDFRYSKLIGEM